MKKTQLYIGLMSGTSADGIDLALVDFSSGSPELVAKHYQAYNEDIHLRITSLYQASNNEIDLAFSLDILLANLFAQAINQLLSQENLSSSDIIAIGNHGQTIRHRPQKSPFVEHPFTLQVGCCQTLATLTNIRVVGQFRRKDIALGGQGAPLVPAFHRAIFSCADNDVFMVNIGGIANLTYLPKNQQEDVLGFDTGPGNALLDSWFQKHNNGRYDKGGVWAASGTMNQALLDQMLADKYFSTSPPKSTGREYFNLDWLSQLLTDKTLSPADIQATLVALTAYSISQDIVQISTVHQVCLTGGGAYNKEIVKLLNQKLTLSSPTELNKKNIDNDSFEAMAFAWFAYAFDKKIISNIPAVTGAYCESTLGNSYNP